MPTCPIIGSGTLFSVALLLETANESVVFAVMSNPEPDDVGAVFHGSGAIVSGCSHGQTTSARPS
jgi:hypothetical protein